MVGGNKVNTVEWSDYVGFAVTSPDFPIVGQIYPHFFFDPETLDNRRRYVSKSEQNILGFTTHNANQETFVFDKPKEENINDQYKKSVKESILFVKYFNSTDNLNLINYENDNVQTALKLDIERTMPLQKFSLNLWLIDRYNNFEEFKINKYDLDEVVKMQILLQRIKGEEKENRTFVDVLELPPRPEQPAENELLIEDGDIPELEPEPEPEPEPVPEVLPIIIPVKTENLPLPEEEEKTPEPPELEDLEEGLEEPESKKIYLINDEEQTENEENNELY